MKRFLTVVAVAGAALTGSGCTASRVVAIDAHPTVPVLHVESELWQGRALLGTEFWSCRDEGTQIACTRSCGPQMELKCPASATAIVTQ